jgi:copper chaperone
MSKVVLDIPEISCEHCSQSIQQALQPQAGVKRVQVDVPNQRVHLEFDENQISLDRVKEILEEEEYPVEAVSQA